MGLESQNFYQRLGLELGASKKEIRQAFRERAAVCHPDAVHASNPEQADDQNLKAKYTKMFQLIQEAYITLANDNSRRRYDRKLNPVAPPRAIKSVRDLPVRVRIVSQ